MIRIIAGTASGLASSSGARSATSDSEKVPRVMPISRMPANSASPPPPVTTSDCRAALRASGRLELKPISMNDSRLVASQKTNITTRLSDSTVPSMAVMNSRISVRKRAASAGEECEK